LSVLADEVLGFGTVDVPGTDEGADISEGAVFGLTLK
jgi:hypothetical protein